MLFVGGAIVVDLVGDEAETETETSGETTAEEGGGEASPGLPNAFVVTRSRDNPTILSTAYEEVVSLTLEPGAYQVFGKLGASNRDPQLSFKVECTLVPAAAGPDGAVEDGSDYGDLYLGPAGQPGESGTIPLAVSQVLEAQGKVSLACRGYGNDAGAFAHYGSIRAIEVGSIEEKEAPAP